MIVLVMVLTIAAAPESRPAGELGPQEKYYWEIGYGWLNGDFGVFSGGVGPLPDQMRLYWTEKRDKIPAVIAERKKMARSRNEFQRKAARAQITALLAWQRSGELMTDDEYLRKMLNITVDNRGRPVFEHIHSARVIQIIDDDEMIVTSKGTTVLLDGRARNYDKPDVWLIGLSTEGLADGHGFKYPVFTEPDGTRSYTTVMGAKRTISVARVVDEVTFTRGISREQFSAVLASAGVSAPVFSKADRTGLNSNRNEAPDAVRAWLLGRYPTKK